MPAVERPLPPGIVRFGPEVFYSRERVLAITPALVAWLTAEARSTPRKRSRLCAHPDSSAAVHEMIIVHHNDAYVRPHRHAGKPESFHRIDGSASIVLFDDDGAIDNVLQLDESRNSPFYLRIPAQMYHTFIVRSEWLVFHETTAGPFERALMEFAPWSPGDDDPAAIARYSEALEHNVCEFLARGTGRQQRS